MTSKRKFSIGTAIMIATVLSLLRTSTLIQQNPHFNQNWILILVVAALAGFTLQIVAFLEINPLKGIPSKK